MIKWLLAIAVATGTLSSCDKDNSLNKESVLNTDEKEYTTLDLWLRSTFLFPYNISVDYEWNQYKVDNNRYLTPADPVNVQKVMKVVKKVWIDSYTEVTYPEFIKEYTNREFVLVGGVNLNKEGTQTLGLADQGQRIVLFTVDLIDVTNVNQIRQFVHTIQHEYVHILNQKKIFDKEAYGEITPAGYDSNWQNYNDQSSRNQGFISAYSRSNVDEDFAEVTAAMLVDINAYNTMVNGISNADGKAKIRAKEALVVDYYKNVWDIDFYELCRKADANTIAAAEEARLGQ
ncbi:putative zinc-binding metallopeptidase [Myroides sp. mNGS23_01]|nr:substrate import-associated zinc metallohydrolase lipoprotein [Myroides sp. mNGS23_01]WHT37786.1 putative zinc-binding metallopeptidase [Myroides sp. mNGS23_01]